MKCKYCSEPMQVVIEKAFFCKNEECPYLKLSTDKKLKGCPREYSDSIK